MKKDLHDLLYTIWIDGKTAMIMRDEPEGTHHYEMMHNEHLIPERFDGETTNKTGILGKTQDREKHDQQKHNQELKKWVEEVAHKVRYAHTIHILGSGDVRYQLQQAIEDNPELRNIVITNSSCRKLSPEKFAEIARENLVV